MITLTKHAFTYLDISFSLSWRSCFSFEWLMKAKPFLNCELSRLLLVEEISVDVPQIQQPEVIEQIVKSPPEPTRVKSPEQIVIMRSPDPVFWTVPLDTGKTFTVTQNVREGDVANIVRPHSEIKVSTPSEPPARLLPQEHPQSAPPELWEQECNWI